MHSQGDGICGEVGKDAWAVSAMPGAGGVVEVELAGCISEGGGDGMKVLEGVAVTGSGIGDKEGEEDEKGGTSGRGDRSGSGNLEGGAGD